MAENLEYRNKCVYCRNGICTSPQASSERTKLETYASDPSLTLHNLTKKVYQANHLKNLATILKVENGDILDNQHTQNDADKNEDAMDTRKKMKFSFTCYVDPKRNPCRARKSSNNL